MSVTCPQGHVSQAADYCDTCGAPIAGAVPAAPAVPPAPAGSAAPAGSSPAAATCPNCQTPNPADSLFCEACGYDFTTGAMPRGSALDLDAAVPGGAGAPGAGGQPPVSAAGSGGPPSTGAAVPDPLAPAVPLAWVAEVWVDPAWYAEQEADEPCPSPGLPVIVPLAVRSVLIGRVSRSRSIHPEVDCGSDVGVSRRQAQLSTDGTRWWIEDLQSSNGTYVGSAGGPLPTAPLVPGERRELAEDDRVYVGAWTRIVVRRATDEERAAG